MASTYSKLKIELIGTGDQAGQWGITTNNNLGSSSAGVYRGLEQAIVGMATISSGFVANSYTLPYTDSNDDQEFRCLVLNITASLSNPSDLIVPLIQKPYIVINSSGQTVTVKVSGQTGVAVPSGAKILLYNTGTGVGTDITSAITYLTELKLGGNLTMPSAGSINDSNGNELIKFPSAVASAVNELTISNAATGSAPTLSATGGDTNIGITLTPKGTGTLFTAGNVSFDGGTFVFNESGADKDFRIEGDTEPNLFFTDASTDRVGIGTSSPGYALDVQKNVATGVLANFQSTNTSATYTGIAFRSAASSAAARNWSLTMNNNAFGDFAIRTSTANGGDPIAAGTDRLVIDSSGNLGLGVTPKTWSTGSTIEVGNYFLKLSGSTTYGAVVLNNAYYNGGWKFAEANWANMYQTAGGVHSWHTSTAAGTAAGNAITFTQAMTLDASGNLGVGATSPTLVAGYKTIETQGSTGGIFQTSASGNTVKARFYSTQTAGYVGTNSNDPFAVITNDTERARITSGGDFFIGNGETAASPSAGILSATGGTGTNIAGANLTIRGGASTGTGAGGVIIFSTAAASGTSGTATNSASERARITSGGYFKASNNGTYVNSTSSVHEFCNNANGRTIDVYNSNASLADVLQFSVAERAASTAYNFYIGRSGGTTGDTEFTLRGDGNGYADGTWNNNGADYAEYFESANGQALTLGASVVLDNNKVREATSQDLPSAIIGVVRPKEPSKASMVVGNTAWNKWANKYLTDDFDRYIMEDHDVVEWEEHILEREAIAGVEAVIDEEGNEISPAVPAQEAVYRTKQHSYESHNIPAGVTVPGDAIRKTHDDKGNKFQHYKLNPAWDKDVEYINRENRPEWNIIGLVGQVKVLKGQPANDRWIKMRDVSANVEEWFIR